VLVVAVQDVILHQVRVLVETAVEEATPLEQRIPVVVLQEVLLVVQVWLFCDTHRTTQSPLEQA
jgi:hypothetical protein